MDNQIKESLAEEALSLLKQLIRIQSFSREESETAGLISDFLSQKGIPLKREGNNVWAQNKHFNPGLPSILLNSHHDTVKPHKDWQRDPFKPSVENGNLFGLGSNDAGGALISYLATFCHFYQKENLSYNLIFAASAEEEISGKNGIASILPLLTKVEFALVGEPTEMQMAIAEKGLMVLDCAAHGKSGHAARDEGVNALYLAIDDINWFRSFQFPNTSPTLGPVKMSVTIIESGTQHNVVPATCKFTVDVRTTDAYSNIETLEIIQQHTNSEVKARSTRLNPSSIPEDHPIVKAGKLFGLKTFGSPTLSDQALMPFPTLKIGPGKSERSHTPDEFIKIKEIKEGIGILIKILGEVLSGVKPN